MKYPHGVSAMGEREERHDNLLSIEDAAKRTGLSPEDIEVAEQRGLLAVGREREGYYTPTQLRLLDGIACLRELGLSMDEIDDLHLSEEILAEVGECLKPLGIGRSLFEASSAFLMASAHAIRRHEQIVREQMNQLRNLERALSRKADAFERLLRVIQGHARRAA